MCVRHLKRRVFGMKQLGNTKNLYYHPNELKIHSFGYM